MIAGMGKMLVSRAGPLARPTRTQQTLAAESQPSTDTSTAKLKLAI